MFQRIRLWSALVPLGALLLAGCTTSSVQTQPGKSTSGSPSSPTDPRPGQRSVRPRPPSSAEAQDYSKSAVSSRTEAHARYTAGVLAELDDDPQAAADHFHQAALADPSNESLVLEAAGKLLRQKQTDRAIEVLKACAARPTSSAGIHARLGLAYSVAGKKELAIEASRQAIRKGPTEFEGYQYLAQMHLQAGRKDEGLRVLDEAGRQPKPDAEFLVDLGDAYLAFARGGSTDALKAKALAAFQRAADLKPAEAVLLQRLGDGFNQLGETDRAVDFYRRVLQKLPQLTFVRDRLVEIYLRRDDRTNAAEQLRLILQESPANPRAQYLLGSIYLEEKKLAEAEDALGKSILLNPGFEPAYYELAAVLINADKARQALELLGKAKGKFEQNFVGEFYAGLAQSRLKDYESALRHFTAAEVIARASETNRLTPTFYFQLGAAAERTKRFDEAERHFQKALKLQPDFAEALNYLGYMWAERGQKLDDARKMIEKAVQLEPENGAFLDSLGWVIYQQGRPQEALPWILKSLKFTEEPDATLYDHLGDIHHKLNQTDKARDAWKKSLEIERNPEVEKKLKGVPGR